MIITFLQAAFMFRLSAGLITSVLFYLLMLVFKEWVLTPDEEVMGESKYF